MKEKISLSLMILFCGSIWIHAQEPPSRDACREKTVRERHPRTDCGCNPAPEWLSLFRTNRTLLPAGPEERLKAIVPDFQVNDNEGPCGAVQEECTITVGGIGNSIIAWSDRRNGYSNIYAQIFDDKRFFNGTNLNVNDDIEEINTWDPQVCMDSEGNFVIVWYCTQPYPVSERSLMARCFTNQGEPRGNSFHVAPLDGSQIYRYPAMAMADQGHFAIAWNMDNNVYLRFFSQDGSSKTECIKLGETGSRPYCCCGPSISMSKDGSAFVVWADDIDYDYDIYGQIVNDEGVSIQSSFRINENDNVSQAIPSVAICGNGNFMVTWTNYQFYSQGDDEVYARVFDQDGIPVSGELLVNDDESSTHQYNSHAIVYKDSCFLAYWWDRRDGEDEIYAQIYSWNGIEIGSNFKIGSNLEINQYLDMFSFSMVSDDTGNLIVAFTAAEENENSSLVTDTFIQEMNSSGIPMSNPVKVNDDVHSASQSEPSISLSKDGHFFIVWLDTRNGKYTEYFYSQFSNSFVVKVVENKKLDQGSGMIISDQNGHALGIEIEHGQSDNSMIFGNYYDLRSGSNGDRFLIVTINERGIYRYSTYNAALHNDGYLLLVWIEDQQYLYYQPFSVLGNPLGDKTQVNSNMDDYSIDYPVVAINECGEFVICWMHGNRVMAQVFSANGGKEGENFQVDRMSSPMNGYSFISDISMNKHGQFAVTWVTSKYHEYSISSNYDDGYTEKNVCVQICSLDEHWIGNTIVIDDEEDKTQQYNSKVFVDDDGKCIFVWEDNRNGTWDIYGQRIKKDGTLLGGSFQIPCSSDRTQSEPDVFLYKDIIYTVWQDNRIEGNGWDVWANMLDWDNPTKNHQPGSEFLCQNFPNPFNEYTFFYYTVQEECRVSLAVYDVLGREIKALVDKRQGPGTYTVFFGAGDLSSGVYFYRFKAGEKEGMKKMVVMK